MYPLAILCILSKVVTILAGNFFSTQVIRNKMLATSITPSKHKCLLKDVDWLECALRCNRDDHCVSYNYNLTFETCWLQAFGLVGECGEKRLMYSEGALFQQIREDENQLKCMSATTCGNSIQQVGQESCQVKPVRSSCKEILDNGESRGDGEYTIKPDGVERSVHCDMTTKGGGWTLIKIYTITAVPFSPGSTSFVTNVNQILGSYRDPRTLINVSGLRSVQDTLGFKQMRWFCHKQSVGKKVHIVTNDDSAGESVIKYFTGSKTPAKACGSFTKLPDDTSKLSDSCSQWGKTQGQDQWGSTDYSGEQKIHGSIMVFNSFTAHFFSMMPGRFQCDDEDPDKLTVNDSWSLYVR